MAYVDFEYYKNEYKGTMDEANATKALEQASRHIDTLTYNRIVLAGFDNLGDFQQEVISETCCMMADWEQSNADVINSLLTSYSLNGASMSFTGASANCAIKNGVAIQRDTYAYLAQTGLCCASLGV